MASIAVQPPTQNPTNTQLYPPVVARIRADGIASAEQSDFAYLFAMAVLLDHNGNILEGQLGGTPVVTGMHMLDGSGGSGSSSSAPSSLYFAFPDLYMSWAGTYSIRIDVYVVDYHDPNGARLLAQAETRSIAVYDEDVAVERPGKRDPSTSHASQPLLSPR